MDASAGTGLLAEKILGEFGSIKRFVLNDPAENMLRNAKKRLSDYSDIEFTNSFCEELDFPKQCFDKILCLNSFHYYVDQTLILDQFQKFLKPGGELYILDWNRKGFFKIVNRLIDLFSPENINTRTLEELEDGLIEAGFSTVKKEEWNYRWWKFYFVISELR